MPADVTVSLVQGETFFLDLEIVDTDGTPVDVSGAAKSVTVGTGISAGDFSVTNGSSTGQVKVKATNTSTWPVGVTPMRVWFDFGASADVEDEVQIEVDIAVEAAL